MSDIDKRPSLTAELICELALIIIIGAILIIAISRC